MGIAAKKKMENKLVIMYARHSVTKNRYHRKRFVKEQNRSKSPADLARSGNRGAIASWNFFYRKVLPVDPEVKNRCRSSLAALWNTFRHPDDRLMKCRRQVVRENYAARVIQRFAEGVE